MLLPRTVYFFINNSPLPFRVCGIFQLSVDCGMFSLRNRVPLTHEMPAAIVIQRLMYGNAPPAATLMVDDDIEQALALAEE